MNHKTGRLFVLIIMLMQFLNQIKVSTTIMMEPRVSFNDRYIVVIRVGRAFSNRRKEVQIPHIGEKLNNNSRHHLKMKQRDNRQAQIESKHIAEKRKSERDVNKSQNKHGSEIDEG